MKAIHAGHCQCCGRLQRLPNGKLSLHGYSKTFGYFLGICRGARYKPFEESCDQVERYIGEAKDAALNLKAFQVELRTKLTTKAWVKHYNKNSQYGLGYAASCKWIEVTPELTVDPWLDGGGASYQFHYTLEEKKHRIEYSYSQQSKTVEEEASRLNRVYATSFDREVESLESYIKWQTKRVTEWKPAPLHALTVKDKEGFEAFA